MDPLLIATELAALVELDDKYKAVSGAVLITGVQALARALLDQAASDSTAGHKTAGYVSGYRGSPIGGLDIALWKIKKDLSAASIHFEPGVNEELAATAVWGTQQLNLVPRPKFEGVFAMWYGKGPGVDRAGDAIRHGNVSGSSRHGGVLLVFGDDHAGKSSTLAHHSEHTLASLSVPILYPSTVQEVLDFGLYGWSLSRYSGCWSALKMVNETAEKTAVIRVGAGRHKFITPVSLIEEEFAGAPQQYDVTGDDVRLQRRRLPRVHEFSRANGVDGCVLGDENAKLGLVTAGKSYLDVLEALRLLKIDGQNARRIGLAVYKVGLIFPLEPTRLTAFALGKRELLFVEEKKAFIEPQAASILFNLTEAERPLITGKRSESGDFLLPSDVQLTPEELADVIASRLRRLDSVGASVSSRRVSIEEDGSRKPQALASRSNRIPYFCAGCPHNTSTKVPDGSVAFSGIGCHGMAAWMERNTALPTQMGGEGMNWVGMARFTETPHVFQNMGDGTFYHSGLLAIRGALSANATVTFKILVNDAVAMTGGQPVEGKLGVKGVVESLLAEGVGRIAVVTVGDVSDYRPLRRFKDRVTLHRRESLAEVQTEMRRRAGVSAIVYDQACAAELRRRRKRGTAPDPNRRVFINTEVCEGCGDCTKQSNCVAVVPVETDWGRKRAIDQSTCNEDFSCLGGFCPAMVTVHGAAVPKRNVSLDAELLRSLTTPVQLRESANILVAGIGGTGVITIGAILCMAAHLEGKGASAFDMTGLAQKGGAVYSHIRITRTVSEERAAKIGTADADIVIAADLVASTHQSVLSTVGRSTTCVLNTQYVPTAAFQLDNEANFRESETLRLLQGALAPGNLGSFNASAAALNFMGDTLQSNMLLLGFALQRGWLPVGVEALKKAIRLNGESVASNLLAVDLGRVAATSPEKFSALLPGKTLRADKVTLSEFLDGRRQFLTDYQDAKYAAKFLQVIGEVRTVEEKTCPGSEQLCWAVARTLSQVMSYKDEYEVARLYSSPQFGRTLNANFTGKFSLYYHLAPPILAMRNKETDLPRKVQVGQWFTPLLRLLARLKSLRDTRFDPFGYSKDRRLERELIGKVLETVRLLLAHLGPSTMAQAVEIVEHYQGIRGFGHVKERNANRILAEIDVKLAQLTR